MRLHKERLEQPARVGLEFAIDAGAAHPCAEPRMKAVRRVATMELLACRVWNCTGGRDNGRGRCRSALGQCRIFRIVVGLQGRRQLYVSLFPLQSGSSR
jgi:hypothetical protein